MNATRLLGLIGNRQLRRHDRRRGQLHRHGKVHAIGDGTPKGYPHHYRQQRRLFDLQHYSNGQPERHGHGLLDFRLARVTDRFARQSRPLHADPDSTQRVQRLRNPGM